MSGHQSGTGIPSQPARLGGAAAGGGGFPADAVQVIAYDPAGGDVERAWRLKNLNDFVLRQVDFSGKAADMIPDPDNPGSYKVNILTVPASSLLVIYGIAVTEAWDDSANSQAVGDSSGAQASNSVFVFNHNGLHALYTVKSIWTPEGFVLSSNGHNGDGTTGACTLLYALSSGL